MRSIRKLSVRQYGLEIDCFEVGKEQLKDLLGWYADIDVANKSFSKLFTNKTIIGLVVEMRRKPGEDDEPRFGSWITSLDSAREVISNEYGYELSFGYMPIFEVWFVRDDAELWQEWEYGVAKSHIAQSMCTDYHLYENRNCVLDCVRKLPKVVFSLCTTCEDGTFDSYHYYADFDHFLYDLRFESWLNRNEIENVKTYYAHELGITVVNDDGLDEGLAKVLPVVVFYLSRQHNE